MDQRKRLHVLCCLVLDLNCQQRYLVKLDFALRGFITSVEGVPSWFWAFYYLWYELCCGKKGFHLPKWWLYPTSHHNYNWGSTKKKKKNRSVRGQFDLWHAENWSIKKSFDKVQPAHSAQADLCRYFLAGVLYPTFHRARLLYFVHNDGRSDSYKICWKLKGYSF